ncbi:DUF3108 domain-containing protein [Salinarimonas sp. NSM]|uniref:DUF3108 domain-containing protein n=1 Tax=Salinarimonas sp. NSM TaxID=3458003 RepID=UPI004036E7F9
MRARRLARALLAAAFGAVLAASPGGASASGSSFDATYGIWLAGFPIGEADVTSSSDGRRYEISVQARLVGLAGLITDGRGAATATGRVDGERVTPASFAVNSASSRASRTVRMGLSGGAVAAVEILPPLPEHPDRVPVRAAHRRGVVDPVSAFLFPARGRLAATDPGQCERTIPVFDGASRFDIVLSYGGTRDLDKPGYSGPVLICKARFRAVSGHRDGKEAVRFMEDNRDMAVWLAPVEAGGVLLPMRIEVRTQIGMSIIEASRVSIDGGGVARGASN